MQRGGRGLSLGRLSLSEVSQTGDTGRLEEIQPFAMTARGGFGGARTRTGT
jgi:hypothetical protein